MKLWKKRIHREESFREKLIELVLPITLQQFMLALVSAADALMLGMVNQNALSAVSLAAQIAFVENLFIMAMTIGQSILVAQYYGKKDYETVRVVSSFILKITAAMALAFSITAFLMPETLMRVFTDDRILIRQGAEYLRIVSPSYLITGISQIYLCLMKNCGMAGRVGWISSTGVVINICLNGVLILGLMGFPRMEIAGAAIATVSAKTVEMIWSIICVLRQKNLALSSDLRRQTDKEIRKKFWKYTRPVLCNEIVWGTGFTMYSVIMGHLGTDAVAANSITAIVKNLAACFCNGIGAGAGVLVGNELGAGNLIKAREYGKKLVHLAIGSGILSGLLIVLLAPLIIRITNLSSESTEYLRWMLLMCSYYMIGKSVNSTTIAGIFCAGGDSTFGLICDLITMWFVIVPLGLLAAFRLQVPVIGVYFILNLDEMLKLPAVYRNYKKYRWLKNLTQEK